MRCFLIASSAFLALSWQALGREGTNILRIVQLDLARHPEQLSFISNYIDHVSEWGYNALELYLEGRVATGTFSLREGRTYSTNEMKAIVRHAERKGMDVIPVVSFLAHAEQFFKDPSLMEMCETRENIFRVPFIHDTFCYSQPQTLSFIANYVSDLCEVFTGPYFHVGFDEAWNSGCCTKCSKKDGDALFCEQVNAVYGILKSQGKRMMMWDDFFEFHRPVLRRIPRDVVLMHWNYATDISTFGPRCFVPGSLRRNCLAEYASLGFDAIPCAWYECDNIRTFIRYADRNPSAGYLQTHWEEMIENFHGGSLPRVLAAAMMLEDPEGDGAEDVFLRAVKRLEPKLTEAECLAASRLLQDPSDELAFGVLFQIDSVDLNGPVDPDPFSGRAIVDELVCRSRMAIAQAKMDKARTILSDPRRTAGDIAAARKLLESVRTDADILAGRRSAQNRVWRPGEDDWYVTHGPHDLAKSAASLSQQAVLARPDEKRIEIEFSRIDRWVRPTWRVEGEFGGIWKEIASFQLLHGEKRRPDFTHGLTFSAETMPTRIKLSHKGFGDCQVRFVSVVDKDNRLVPESVVDVAGNVKDANAILVDDYTPVTFGRSGYLAQFNDKTEADKISSVTVSMVPEGTAVVHEIQETVGVDFTNRFVRVGVRFDSQLVSAGCRVRLCVKGADGKEIGSIERDVSTAGDYLFDVGSAAELLPGRSYCCVVAVVDSDGTVVGGDHAGVAIVDFVQANWSQWFAACASNNVVSGGEWLFKPDSVAGICKLTGAGASSMAEFRASQGRSGLVRAVGRVRISQGSSESDLGREAERLSVNPPQGALAVKEDERGALSWVGLVQEGDSCSFRDLLGADVPLGQECQCAVEINWDSGTPRVSYLVGAAAGRFSRLRDHEGDMWFPCGGNELTESQVVSAVGVCDLFSIKGFVGDVSVAEVEGVGYGSFTDALMASRKQGAAVRLRTNVSIDPAIICQGSYHVISDGFSIKIAESSRLAVYDEKNSILTIEPDSGFVIQIVKQDCDR